MIGSLFAVLFRSKPRNGTRDEGVELRGEELHVSLHLAIKKSARISASLTRARDFTRSHWKTGDENRLPTLANSVASLRAKVREIPKVYKYCRLRHDPL